MGEKRDPHVFQRGWEVYARGESLSRTFFLRRDALQSPVWEPPVDVYASGRDVFVLVALPGVEAARIQVRLGPGELIVAGERSRPTSCQGLEVRQLEIPYGRFERRVALSLVRPKLERRELADGCLLLLIVEQV
jgi:HSP20 family molecular chaperone IbpA